MAENRKTIRYEGRIFRIVQEEHRFGDEVKTFELAQRSPGVRLIVPSEDRKNILLIREFRYERNAEDERLPGGKVFDQLQDYIASQGNGEDISRLAEHAARKELLEEVGLKATRLRFLHKVVCGATVEWDSYYFLVEAFEETGSQSLESGEQITFAWVPNQEAEEMCLDGRIAEERSALILLRYLRGKL